MGWSLCPPVELLLTDIQAYLLWRNVERYCPKVDFRVVIGAR